MIEKKYVYFLYSEEQIKEKNKILSKHAKQFQPGIVVVNGERKEYTIKSENSSLPRFYDSKVVAEGYEDAFMYEPSKTINMKGN